MFIVGLVGCVSSHSTTTQSIVEIKPVTSMYHQTRFDMYGRRLRWDDCCGYVLESADRYVTPQLLPILDNSHKFHTPSTKKIKISH